MLYFAQLKVHILGQFYSYFLMKLIICCLSFSINLIIVLFCIFEECKVWRNPLNLLRGGEYHRFSTSTGKDPLTYYDMNLSAQDHQTYFTCEADVGKQEYESRFLQMYLL